MSVIDPIDSAKQVAPIQVDVLGNKRFTTKNGRQFLITPTGVYVELQEGVKAFVCSFLEVTDVFRDTRKTTWGRVVRFYDVDGQEHVKMVHMSQLVNFQSTLVNELVEEGLKVDIAKKQLVLEFINEYPTEALTKAICTNTLGSDPEGRFFVYPDMSQPLGYRVYGKPLNGEKVLFIGRQGNIPNYSSKGTLKEWQEHVAITARYSTLVAFVLCVVFAARLMKLMNVESCIFHFYGKSSAGKSTLLRVAGSACGSTSSGGVIHGWNSTRNGMEAFTSDREDDVSFYDEISTNENSDFVAQIYQFGNQTGKRRMDKNGGARPVSTWRMMILSTGERSLEQMVGKTDAGVSMRFIGIELNKDRDGIFDHKPAEIVELKEITDKIRHDTAFEYYGTAVPAFLEKLYENLSSDDAKLRLLDRLNRYKKSFYAGCDLEDDNQVRRVSEHFANVAAGGELAIALGIMPLDQGEALKVCSEVARLWRKNFKTESERKNDEIEFVKNFSQRYKKAFHIIDKSDSRLEKTKCQSQECFGYILHERQCTKVYYFKEAFKEKLCHELGVEAKKLLGNLKEKKMLQVNDGNFAVKLPRETKGIPKGRYYCLLLEE